MDTKLATSQIRLNQWTAVIRECKASGLTVNDYCTQHDLSRHAYFYWLRKVKNAALQQAGFVELPTDPITSSAKTDDFSVQLRITIGDVELGINDDTSSALLARTIEVIRRAQ